MQNYNLKILFCILLFSFCPFFLAFCVSETIVESSPAGFPYNCIGENPSNAHVAELGRRAAIRKDSKMLDWKKPLCYLKENGEEWVVVFFRKDNIPEDVHEVSGGEIIEVRISSKDLRIKSISSNIRYEN